MSRQLLLIEDELVYAKLLVAMVDSLGFDFQVTHETDGASGLAWLRAHPKDVLLLLDLQMPGMNGFQVLTELRGDRAIQHVPVIVLTGNEDLNSQRHSSDLGATSFLAKPIAREGFDALFRTLDSMWPYLVEE